MYTGALPALHLKTSSCVFCFTAILSGSDVIFLGPFCADDVNECVTMSPCQNRATCSNVYGDYICACVSGWTGKNCDVNIDDCALAAGGTPCFNGGTCKDYLGYYRCDCPLGKTGERSNTLYFTILNLDVPLLSSFCPRCPLRVSLS